MLYELILINEIEQRAKIIFLSVLCVCGNVIHAMKCFVGLIMPKLYLNSIKKWILNGFPDS